MNIIISRLKPEKLNDEVIMRYSRWWNQEYPVIFDRMTIKSVQRLFSEHRTTWEILLAQKETTNEPVGLLILQHELIKNRQNWFTIVVDRKYQGRGVGSTLIDKAKSLVEQLHGWVIPFNDYKREDGSYYKSPFNFYLKQGFKIGDDFFVEKKDLHLVEVYWEPTIG
ncbi:MAG: GNAT family N-acetyltransferase [Candidatus Hodarchaeales archaeon]